MPCFPLCNSWFFRGGCLFYHFVYFGQHVGYQYYIRSQHPLNFSECIIFTCTVLVSSQRVFHARSVFSLHNWLEFVYKLKASRQSQCPFVYNFLETFYACMRTQLDKMLLYDHIYSLESCSIDPLSSGMECCSKMSDLNRLPFTFQPSGTQHRFT